MASFLGVESLKMFEIVWVGYSWDQINFSNYVTKIQKAPKWVAVKKELVFAELFFCCEHISSIFKHFFGYFRFLRDIIFSEHYLYRANRVFPTIHFKSWSVLMKMIIIFLITFFLIDHINYTSSHKISGAQWSKTQFIRDLFCSHFNQIRRIFINYLHASGVFGNVNRLKTTL